LKRIYVLILLLNYCFIGFSQKTNNTKNNTILKNETHKIEGIINPEISYTRVDQAFTLLAGGSANLLFSEKYFFGIYGKYSLNDVAIAGYSKIDGYNNSFYNIGFSIGYIFNRNEAIHSSISINAGQGLLSISNISENSTCDFEVSIFSPSYQIDFNLLEYMSFGIGLSYNIISPVDLYVNKDALLSGPSLNITCRIYIL